MLFKKNAMKIFSKITGKHLQWSPFFSKYFVCNFSKRILHCRYSSVSFANFFKTKIFVFYDKTALKKFEKLVFYENYFIFPSFFTTSSFTTTLFWKTFLALKMVLSRNSNLMSTITENSHFSLNLVYKN